MANFKQILSMCCKNGFFQPHTVNKPLVLGPAGTLLKENIRSEWILSTVVNREMNVFLNNSQFTLDDNFTYGAQLNRNKLPFGVAELLSSSETVKEYPDEDLSIKYFNGDPGSLLRCRMFIPASDSIPVFHSWQRQRKMWWRKLSASPGRYKFTDIQQTSGDEQKVEITADFPWLTHTIERIQLQNFDSKKGIHCITSETNLQTMLINMICDSYDEARQITRLHRKLAPYKITFVGHYIDPSVMEEIKQLSVYLCKLLRSANVCTLLRPDTLFDISSPQKLRDANLRCCDSDQLGIPYTIVLTDSTLRNGVCGLRSRDTTLQEEVHISEITTYVNELLKNY